MELEFTPAAGPFSHMIVVEEEAVPYPNHDDDDKQNSNQNNMFRRPDPEVPPCSLAKAKSPREESEFDRYVMEQYYHNLHRKNQALSRSSGSSKMSTEECVDYVHNQLKELYGELDRDSQQYRLMFEELMLVEMEAQQPEVCTLDDTKRWCIQPSFDLEEYRSLSGEAQLPEAYIALEKRSDSSNLDWFLIPRKEMTHHEAAHLMFKKSNTNASNLPLNCFDPRFTPNLCRIPVFINKIAEKKDKYGTMLLKRFDELIAKYPFGITPQSFLDEFTKIYNYSPKVKFSFCEELDDIFLVKKDFSVYATPPARNEPTMLLFPAFMRELQFDVNKFYHKIWHYFQIIILRNHTSLACQDAVKCLKSTFEIDFNPLNWGFRTMRSYFIDCLKKYPDGIHEVTKYEPYSVIRRDWETCKETTVEQKAVSSMEAAMVKMRNNQPISDKGIAKCCTDLIQPGSIIRCVPQSEHNHFYFTVSPWNSWTQLHELVKRMSKFYGNPYAETFRNRKLQALGDQLKPGKYVAVYNAKEKDKFSNFHWQRAMVLGWMNQEYYRVAEADFGGISIVHIINIRYLHEDFLTLPLQAICCKSTYPSEVGIEGHKYIPFDGRSSTRFYLALLDKEFAVHFIRRDAKGLWEVDMTEVKDIPGQEKPALTATNFIQNSFTMLLPYEEKLEKARLDRSRIRNLNRDWRNMGNTELDEKHKEIFQKYGDRASGYQYDYEKLRKMNGGMTMLEKLLTSSKEVINGTNFLDLDSNPSEDQEGQPGFENQLKEDVNFDMLKIFYKY